MSSFPEISLGTAALLIFALCAAYMFIRGLLRTFVTTALLTASAWAGFRMWEEAPALALRWTGNTAPLVTTGLPILTFFLTMILLRKIINFFRAPIPRSVSEVSPKSLGQFIFRLFVTLIPAGIICLTIATFAHHAIAVAEIKNSAQPGTPAAGASGIPERLKNALTAAIPQALMAQLDPLTSPARLKLAKVIASSPTKPLKIVIDPATGRPYPRAIIVDSPELQKLAKEGNFSTLLRHPLLSEALKDPKVRKTLGL